MNGKERFYAALKKEGSPDDIPSLLSEPYTLWRGKLWDTVFGEGQPWWIRDTWSYDIQKQLEILEKTDKLCDCDCVWQVDLCPSREWRKTHKVVPTHRGVYMVDIGPPAGTFLDKTFREGGQHLLEEPRDDGSRGYSLSKDALRSRYGLDILDLIKGKEDIERYVVVEKAEELIENGKLDYVQAIVKKFGEDKFILAGNDQSPAGGCASLLGQTTYFKQMLINPKLLKQTTEKYTDKLIEEYKAYAKMGADGTEAWEWITGQAVSPAQFDEFVKPYTIKVAKALRQIGFKYIYATTGVGKEWMKGLESMLEIPIDAIQLEEPLKGMDTDVSWQATLLKEKNLQDKITLLGNIATINVIQDGTSAELEKEAKRQIEIGREYGRFIMAPGAPITTETSFERIQEYCRLVHKHSRINR